MRNNYLGSPYGHWDYSLFRDLKPYKTKGMKRCFLKSIGGIRYVQKSNTLLLYKLVDYYRDLNINLQRLLNNCYDEMFLRFIYWSKVFGNEERFTEFLLLWDDFFQEALEKYLNEHHTKFDESFRISYVSYFNMHFSKCLTYACLPVLKRYNNKSGYPEDFRFCRDIHHEDFLITSDLVFDPPEHPKQTFLQELTYQSFSP